jgi:hypothetical protein
MAITPDQLVPDYSVFTNPLTDSATKVYTVDSATVVRLTNVHAMNMDTSTRTVTIYIVPASGSATTANIWVQFEVLPVTPLSWPCNKILPDASSLYAKADVTSVVNLFVDGIEDTSGTQ